MEHIPTVKELHSAVDGDGLAISGWFATWDEDTHSEAFVPGAFDTALPNFLQNNPVALLSHDKKSPPIGRVTDAYVVPAKGLFGTIVLPKPEVGTKAMEAYSAVKNKILTNFSVGGHWDRIKIGDRTKLFCRRLLEVSLCSVPVNQWAVADGVTSVVGVKAFGDEWVPAAEYQQHASDWLAVQRLRPQLELAALRLTVAENLLRR